jgi:hypothetical protein
MQVVHFLPGDALRVRFALFVIFFLIARNCDFVIFAVSFIFLRLVLLFFLLFLQCRFTAMGDFFLITAFSGVGNIPYL